MIEAHGLSQRELEYPLLSFILSGALRGFGNQSHVPLVRTITAWLIPQPIKKE
jgi:hypothetical protein